MDQYFDGDVPFEWEEEKAQEEEEEERPSKDQIKHKYVKFKLEKLYEEKQGAGNFGYIEGYASTFEKDRGGDEILPGAFRSTIKRHKKSDDRMIRMYFQHNGMEVIGGFPIDQVKEDKKGLKVVGQINLDVQRGREVYSLAKQGVLSDMSIGYSVKDYDYDKMSGTTFLKDIELWEISIVNEPMNASANILAVKSIDQFMCMKDIENFLKTPTPLSSTQRKTFISKIKQFSSQRDVDEKENQGELRDATGLEAKLNEIILNQKLDKCLSSSNKNKG